MPAVLELSILVIALLGTVFIGLFTFYKNPKSNTNQLFFLFIVTLVVLLSFNYLALHQTSEIITFYWLKLLMSSAVILDQTFLLLILAFPKAKLSLKPIYLCLLILFSGVVIFCSQHGLIFSGVRFSQNNIESIPGIGMPLFFTHTVLFLGGSFFILIKKFKNSFGITKTQLKLLLLGTVLMYSAILIFDYILVLIFNITFFVAFLPIYILVFVGFIGYAIVKHRFLDVGLIVARTVSYSLLIAIFGLFYSVSFAVLSAAFVSSTIESKALTISTTLALIMAFSFQPVRKLLEKATDSLFYKQQYDTNKLLYDLALIMASTLRMEDLTHEILQQVLNQMKIIKGAFILLEEDKVFDIKNEGFNQAPEVSEEEIALICRIKNLAVFDELEEGKLKTLLRNHDLSVAVRLQTEGELVGFLILGEKQSGDIFSEQDLQLLEILAPEAAVAIENTKAYEEIRRFNITLQDEVDKATEELQSANIKLQELDKLKDEFVSLASHELRTPMTAIKGSISTILEGYAGEINSQQKDFLTAAYNENDRLIRLVNNLLNISRIEAGRFTFTITKLDLDKLISEIVGNLQMAAAEKQLYLKYQDDNKPTYVFGDEDKVKEIIINLIGNGIKFTHEGGITVSSQIKDNLVVTSVIDTGHGIATEDQEMLFKKFSQVGKSYTKQAGGTGLGLYISKQMVEGMKGKIWLESTLGKGSTFYFSLPVVGDGV